MNYIHFSIVIPLYNKEKYIARTIQSVLNQTWPYYEVIVVDDGCTDNSVKVIEAFSDDRITIVNQSNSGVSVARNNGIKQAKYNWVALLDGDDEWRPDFLKLLADNIKKNNTCAAYACAFKKIELNHTNKVGDKKFLPAKQGVIDNYFKALFFNGPIMTSSSICLNKKLIEEQGLLPLFPVGVKRGEDLDTWTRIALRNDIFYINSNLVNIHAVQDSTSHGKKYVYEESFDYFKWLDYKPNTYNKTLFLKKYVFKKKRKIIKKLLLQHQFLKAIIVLKDYVKNI